MCCICTDRKAVVVDALQWVVSFLVVFSFSPSPSGVEPFDRPIRGDTFRSAPRA